MKILILCTGNSCRSQMAHGFLKSFNEHLKVFSAGTDPVGKINQTAVAVMKEAGIDISRHTPQNVENYLYTDWDFVITVCGEAHENCPYFPGKVKHRLHMGFDDPSKVQGSEEFILSNFYRVREQIKNSFYKLYKEQIEPEL